MYTDEQYIQFVKKHQSRRKVYSIFSFVLGCGLLIYLHYFLTLPENFNSNVFGIEYMLLEGKEITKTEINSIKSIFESSQIIYTNYGLVMGGAYLAAFNLIVYAIYSFFGGRKEKLLIKLYENKNA